jgi:hypothetical protein
MDDKNLSSSTLNDSARQSHALNFSQTSTAQLMEESDGNTVAENASVAQGIADLPFLLLDVRSLERYQDGHLICGLCSRFDARHAQLT